MKIKLPILLVGLTAVFAFGAVLTPVYATAEVENMTEQEKVEYIEEYKRESEEKKAELRKEAQEKAAELKKQAREKAEEAKKDTNENRQEARKQICEKKEESLKNRIENRQEVADKILNKFTEFDSKIDDFIERKGLVLDESATVQANVIAAELKAKKAVELIKESQVDVNCGDVDVTTQEVTSYRDSVVSAKSALKEYRQELVDYLVAVKTSYNNSVITAPSEDGTEQENETEVEQENETEGGSDV